MKNIKSIVLSLVLLNCLLPEKISSQENTTYNFLKLDIGARAAALGGSFITGKNDVNTIFYNPAALSTLTESQADIGFFKYLLDINSGNLAYSQKLAGSGYVGAGIRYVNYGSFDGRDEQTI